MEPLFGTGLANFVKSPKFKGGGIYLIMLITNGFGDKKV